MKKFFKKFILITFIIPLIVLTGCGKKGEIKTQAEEEVTPLFYKITNNENSSTIYLLGSIHVADDKIYPLNDTIMSAYHASDYLAVECDIVNIDSSIQAEQTKKMMYTDGTMIKDHINEKVYQKMVEFLENKGMYNTVYDSFKPIFFTSLFESLVYEEANLNPNAGIDMHFINLAMKDKKSILEVESIDFQFDLLSTLSDEINNLMLESYIEDYAIQVENTKALYVAWKKGDIKDLERLSLAEDESMTETERKLYEEYKKLLLNNRNHGMASKLEQYMAENKNVFCLVGAGHIVGNEGVAKLLENNGYTVEQIKYK